MDDEYDSKALPLRARMFSPVTNLCPKQFQMTRSQERCLFHILSPQCATLEFNHTWPEKVTEEVPKESEKQEFGNEDGDWQFRYGYYPISDLLLKLGYMKYGVDSSGGHFSRYATVPTRSNTSKGPQYLATTNALSVTLSLDGRALVFSILDHPPSTPFQFFLCLRIVSFGLELLLGNEHSFLSFFQITVASRLN